MNTYLFNKLIKLRKIYHQIKSMEDVFDTYLAFVLWYFW